MYYIIALLYIYLNQMEQWRRIMQVKIISAQALFGDSKPNLNLLIDEKYYFFFIGATLPKRAYVWL